VETRREKTGIGRKESKEREGEKGTGRNTE
jgi:hypothetical protein